MSFMDFLFGQGEKTQQFQRYTDEQQQALNNILRRATGAADQGFNFLESILGQSPEAMQQFQAPALRAFEEETVPSIAERFTGSLGEGSHRSSAFGQQLGKAGASLQENLSAQRGQLGMNALSQLQGLLGAGLTPQFENVFRPATKGFLQQGGESLAQLLPYLLML